MSPQKHRSSRSMGIRLNVPIATSRSVHFVQRIRMCIHPSRTRSRVPTAGHACARSRRRRRSRQNVPKTRTSASEHMRTSASEHMRTSASEHVRTSAGEHVKGQNGNVWGFVGSVSTASTPSVLQERTSMHSMDTHALEPIARRRGDHLPPHWNR